MLRKSYHRCGVSACSFVALCFINAAVPSRASAQEQEAPAAAGGSASPAAAAGAPSDDDASGRIEDIVVVAQRRSERLQDVPIAVTAVTARTLEVNAVVTTNALQNAVPGLTISNQQTSISSFIRGIGNRNTNVGDESAAALYVDGVYTSSLAGSTFSLNNIERIEVLKGPQGTLFGRNAAAGVIQIITRTPSHDSALDMSLSYENYNTVTGQLYATTGLTENLAADIAVYATNQADGWGRNLVTGEEIHKAREVAVRSKWLLQMGDDTEITFGGDYDRNRPALQPIYTAVEGERLLDGSGYRGFYNAFTNLRGSFVTTQWGGNVQLRHNFGDFRFLSITSYRDVKAHGPFDVDGTSVNYTDANFDQSSKTVTQEFQLLSRDNAAFQWIVGAFYFHDTSRLSPLTLTGTALGGQFRERFARQITESYAGFAQATVDLLPRLKATAGLRYTSDRRDITGHDVVNGTISPASIVSKGATFNKLTWHFGLDSKINDNVLLYGSYSRGFKSGVFSASAPTNPAVRPETVDAFEIGFKSDLFDRHLRFNASVFYNLFKDVQLQIPAIGSTLLLNAARGDVRGAEVEITALPVENLQLGVAVSFLDGTYTRFPSSPLYTPLPGGGNLVSAVGVNAAGKDTIYTPPFTLGLTGQYRIPTAVGDFELNGSMSYNDGFFYDTQNRTRQSSYTLLNASIGWTEKSGRFGIQLFGRNLGGTKYYSQLVPQNFGDTASPNAPRTYGITGRFKLN